MVYIIHYLLFIAPCLHACSLSKLDMLEDRLAALASRMEQQLQQQQEQERQAITAAAQTGAAEVFESNAKASKVGLARN